MKRQDSRHTACAAATRIAMVLVATCVMVACSAATAQVSIVSDGRPQAMVVTADDPAMVATYAARELVHHIEKATGQKLQIVAESDIPEGIESRIFIGMTEAARKRGIDPEKMKPDEFVLRTVGRDLYVLGLEDKARDVVLGEPADNDWSHKILHDGIWGYRGPSSISPNGTLFGVYEILERYVRVRWLWPGELGTHVPRTDDILIDDSLDEYHVPKIPWRRFPWFHIKYALQKYDPRTERLAFSPQGLRKFWEATGVYLGRHRMGYSTHPPTFREEFAWKPWKGEGTTITQEHPEFYAMDAGGRRSGQPGYRYGWPDMCVSNPDLHRFILDKVWKGQGTLRLGQCNTVQYCQCPKCMAWDGPQPQPVDIPDFERNAYGPRSVSYRYARFWKTMYEQAAKRNPNVRATVLMYQTTLPAPGNIKLSANIYGEFCPWSGAATYFPMPEEVDQWSRKQWLGWSQTGISMIWRPNHLHGSYTMPYLSTRQVGEYFKFAYKNGLKGFLSDSLRVSWATQGPMIYIHMALGWDPDLDVEELRQDFWSAFGPAASEVERYFDYWEAYSLAHPQGSLYSPIRANAAFPPAEFAKQAAVLESALKIAVSDPLPEYAERVRFLQAGLEHARLCARFMGALEMGKVPSNRAGFLEAQQALKQLIGFRRAKEHLFISDYIDAAAFRERGNVAVDSLFEDVENVEFGLKPLPGFEDVRVVNLSNPWGQWKFRLDLEDKGLNDKWHEADIDEKDWRPAIVPAFLADAGVGVGQFVGHGWYRVKFRVPQVFRGRTFYLHFEGVDEQAWVYINGTKVGEHTIESEGKPVDILWNEPFAIKVEPKHLHFGRDSVLVVRVKCSQGQCGIWRPVRLYYEEAPMNPEEFE